MGLWTADLHVAGNTPLTGKEFRMDYRLLNAVAAASALAVFSWNPLQVAAQQTGEVTNSTAKPAAPNTPRMADGHPNLSGTWHTTSGHVIARPGRSEEHTSELQ